MKFSTKFTIYKNIILLIWWLGVIIAFKVINNFEFKNGSSLIFIGLLFIIPFIIYILGALQKKKLLREKTLKQGKYIDLIKKDIDDKKIDKELLKYLSDLNLSYIQKENSYIYMNDKIILGFNEEYAYIQLVNTRIIYHFYYRNKFIDYTKYDERYIQYHPTTRLYSLMISKIDELKNRDFLYKENKWTIKLIDINTKNVVYNLSKNRYDKYYKNKKISIKL